MLRPNERTAVLIDGMNLYTASRNLGFDVDYRSLLQFFDERCDLVRATYYSLVIESDEYSPLKPLIDWLGYNGYGLVTKFVREVVEGGRRRPRSNMLVEIAVGMLEVAPFVQHIVLFSGDAEYRAAIEAVQRLGVRVTVVSTIRTSPPTIGDELRRQADRFVDLGDLSPEITRRLREGKETSAG